VSAPLPVGWSRLHPLTPLLRGGRFFLLVGVYAGQQGLRQSDSKVLLGILAVGTPLAVVLGFFSWRAMRYRVEGAELHLDSGILQRRSRRVPLVRVQSIDVVRPLFARVLGLAELRLEVVGGGDTEARLSYLTEDQAQQLRARLLGLVAGERAGDGPAGEVQGGEVSRQPAAIAPEAVLVTVPTGVLVVSVLLGAPTLTLLVLVLAAGLGLLVDAGVVLPVVLASGPVLLGVVTASGRRLLTEYGFTVAESPDGLRLRHGLLDTRSQTIPSGRVQTVRVREPLLWRRQGWVRLEVDVAGYAGGRGEEQAATSALLPVAPRALAESLLERVLGGPLPAASLAAPRRARLRAPLQHRRLRVGVDATHLVATYGVLTTTTDVVPLAKVQSLRLTAGPWQRRLGLASLHVDTAGRRLPGAVARHRDAGQARELLGRVNELAKAAR